MTTENRIHIHYNPNRAITADKRPFSGLSLLLWVMASAAGWVLPIPILGLLTSFRWISGYFYGPYGFPLSLIPGILLGISFGTALGVLQWLVLRRHIDRASKWIAATMLGLTLGVPVGFSIFYGLYTSGKSLMMSWISTLLPASLVAGIAVGLAQYVVLRWYFHRALWWLVPSSLSGLAVFLIHSSANFSAVFAIFIVGPGGLVLGVLSGVTLFFISRRRRIGAKSLLDSTVKPITAWWQYIVGNCFPLKPGVPIFIKLPMFLWVLASIAGWMLGSFIFAISMSKINPLLNLLMRLMEPYGEIGSRVLPMIIWGILIAASLGTTLGIFQWLILRRHIPRASSWIADTVLGLGLGAPAGFLAMQVGSRSHAYPDLGVVIGLGMFFVPGIIVGLVQTLTLRKQFNQIWWWLIPSALSWPVIILSFEVGLPVGLAILAGLGLVTGIISGITLHFISRNLKEGEFPLGQQQTASKAIRIGVSSNVLARSVLTFLLVTLVVITGVPLTREFSARQPLLTLKGHTDGISNMAFSPDGALLASASYDGTIRLWRVGEGEFLQVLEHVTQQERSRMSFYADGKRFPMNFNVSVSFSPDGETLASGVGSNNTVKLWRVNDGTLLRMLSGAGRGVAFSPDGLKLASLERSYTIGPGNRTKYWSTPVIWRLADGKRLLTAESAPYSGDHLVFSPDGSTIADGLGLWQAEDGVLLYVLTDGGYVAFSPNGKTLVTGLNNKILFWNVDDGSLLRESAGLARAIAFSPDGAILASTNGYMVKFANADDGTILQTVTEAGEHYDTIRSVVLSPDLRLMAVGDYLGVIRVHELELPVIEKSMPSGLISPPLLISPEEGAVLDNGRTDHLDSIAWDFVWSNSEGASVYHLYVTGPGGNLPLVDKNDIATSHFQVTRDGSYIRESSYSGWTWKVRAKVYGEWTRWSQVRTFDVEPANTDPPR